MEKKVNTTEKTGISFFYIAYQSSLNEYEVLSFSEKVEKTVGTCFARINGNIDLASYGIQSNFQGKNSRTDRNNGFCDHYLKIG